MCFTKLNQKVPGLLCTELMYKTNSEEYSSVYVGHRSSYLKVTMNGCMHGFLATFLHITVILSQSHSRTHFHYIIPLLLFHTRRNTDPSRNRSQNCFLSNLRSLTRSYFIPNLLQTQWLLCSDFVMATSQMPLQFHEKICSLLELLTCIRYNYELRFMADSISDPSQYLQEES